MKKIKKQRLSLESTVIRKLGDPELTGIAGGCINTIIIGHETVYPCGKCTYINSGCYNKN